jgi:hypothetical protein
MDEAASYLAASSIFMLQISAWCWYIMTMAWQPAEWQAGLSACEPGGANRG